MATISVIPIWKSLQEIMDKSLDKANSFIYNKNRKRQDLKRLCPKNFVIKITLLALVGWRYFFMEITKSNRTIINEIMYSLSIAITPFRSVA